MEGAAEFLFGPYQCQIFIPEDGLKDYTAIERSLGVSSVNVFDATGTRPVSLSEIRPGGTYVVTGSQTLETSSSMTPSLPSVPAAPAVPFIPTVPPLSRQRSWGGKVANTPTRRMFAIVAEALSRYACSAQALASGDVRRLGDTAAAFALDYAPLVEVLARTNLQSLVPLIAGLQREADVSADGNAERIDELVRALGDEDTRVAVALFVNEVLARSAVQQAYVRRDLRPLVAAISHAAQVALSQDMA